MSKILITGGAGFTQHQPNCKGVCGVNTLMRNFLSVSFNIEYL